MPLPRDIDAYLTRRFYDPSSPGSFTSPHKLHSVIKNEGRYNISLNRINDWAKSQDIITLHKEARQKPRRYRRVIAHGMDHLWDCDLLVLNGERFKRANDGFAYILVTIDVFSRYCRAEPVKSKGGKHVSQGFKKIFDSLETESETETDAETVVEAVAGEMRPQLAIPDSSEAIEGRNLPMLNLPR